MGLARELLDALLKGLDEGLQLLVLGAQACILAFEFLHAAVYMVRRQSPLPSISNHVTGWEYTGSRRLAQV
jgi:hypothetical protein